MMGNKNEPGDIVPEIKPDRPDVLPVLPSEPAEMPVVVPKDDPEIVIKSKSEYSNSLHALLQKNKLSSPDRAEPLSGNPDIENL